MSNTNQLQDFIKFLESQLESTCDSNCNFNDYINDLCNKFLTQNNKVLL